MCICVRVHVHVCVRVSVWDVWDVQVPTETRRGRQTLWSLELRGFESCTMRVLRIKHLHKKSKNANPWIIFLVPRPLREQRDNGPASQHGFPEPKSGMLKLHSNFKSLACV